MAKNNFLATLLRRVWVYYVTTFAAIVVGYLHPFSEYPHPPTDFQRLSLAQCLLLAMNCVFFIFVKPRALLQACEAPDIEATPPGKPYEKLGYTADAWDESKKLMEDSLWQFRNAWLCALGSWALLYFFLYLSVFLRENAQMHVPVDLWVDMLNVISHGALVACYVILAKKTHGRERIPPFACGLFVVLICAALELGGVGLASLSPKPDENRELVILISGSCFGILGGMFLGLLVGQLDSEHLGAPIWLLALLFGYAAIQPLYPVLHGAINVSGVSSFFPEDVLDLVKPVVDASRTLLIGIAGVLKLLLCGFLFKSFTRGRLLYYFARKRAIAEKVEEEWASFEKMMKNQDAARP